MWWNTGPFTQRNMARGQGNYLPVVAGSAGGMGATMKSANTARQGMSATQTMKSTYTAQSAMMVKTKTGSFFNKDGNMTDVDEFNRNLTNKFGSITRAWRLAMDTDESGQLNFREFCTSAREMGFVGNIRTLWFNLDTDMSGAISLHELDPESAQTLEKFRALSCERYDTIPNMWYQLLDDDRSGSVDVEEFCENVRELGYEDEEEIYRLFGLLLLRPGKRSIQLKDIMFLQGWEDTKREQQFRKRLPVGWINSDPFLANGANSSCSTRCSTRVGGGTSMSATTGAETDWSNYVRDDVPKMQQDFKNFLIAKYGNLCKAFDNMDSNESGSLSFTEFQTVVTSILQYCKTSDAKRIFLSFQDDKDALLTWDEMGITSTEWINHQFNKNLARKKLEVQKRVTAQARLGTSPRMTAAVEKHMKRVGPSTPRGDVAFWMPLPQGWGFPPDFDPRRRNHNHLADATHVKASVK